MCWLWVLFKNRTVYVCHIYINVGDDLLSYFTVFARTDLEHSSILFESKDRLSYFYTGFWYSGLPDVFLNGNMFDICSNILENLEHVCKSLFWETIQARVS